MSFPNCCRPAVDGEDGDEEGEAGRDNRTGGGRKAVEDEVCLSDDTGGQLRAGQGVHEQGILNVGMNLRTEDLRTGIYLRFQW